MKEMIEIEFGQISEPGKKTKRWVWTCPCVECAQIPLNLRLHGPFKTLRQAERDADRWIAAAFGAPDMKFIDGGELPSIAQH